MNKAKTVGCKIEGCDKKHHGKGYCHNHLEQARQQGLIEPRKWIKICTVKDCTNPHSANGFCIMHRGRNRKGLSMDLPYATKNKYLTGNLAFEHKDRNSWSKAVKQIFEDKCMICGWSEAPCDVHHITQHSKGGLNNLYNAIVLCPNHHKLADTNKISADELQKLNIEKIKTLTMVEPLEDKQ